MPSGFFLEAVVFFVVAVADDGGADFRHLVLEILVTAVQVVHTAHGAFAFGDEGRKDEACGGAEVAAHDFGAFELGAALDCRGVAVHLDVGAKALQFGHVLESVVIDGILDNAVSRNRDERRHERRLHVGGVSREGERLDGDGLEFYVAGVDFGPVRTDAHLAAHVAEGVQGRGDVVGNDFSDFNAAAGDSCRAEVRARFDAVGNGEPFAGAEAFDALHREGACAAALDFGAHRDEVIDEVVYFGFERRVLQHAGALGESCRHEHVHGGADARNGEVERSAGEATFAGGFHVTAGEVNLCTERLEPLQMEVYGAGAPGAPAGERDAAAAEARHERAKHVKAGAHRLYEFVGGFQVVGAARVNLELVCFSADAAADNAQHVAHSLHVLEVRHVCDFGNAVGKESGRHHGEHGVLGARNLHFAIEWLFDLMNFKAVHIS